jgi:hypothetical protein
LRNLFPGFCSGVFRTWSGSEMDASFNNCRIQPGSGSGRVLVAQLISGVLFRGFPYMIRVWNGVEFRPLPGRGPGTQSPRCRTEKHILSPLQ